MKLKQQDVTVGKIYAVQHKRKGHFVGELIRIEATPADDPEDPFFLTMKIDVRKGTDQARLANAGESVAVKNIRPSLIVSIAETGEASWLRSVHVQMPKSQDELQREEQQRQVEAIRLALMQVELEKTTAYKPGLLERLRGRKH